MESLSVRQARTFLAVARSGSVTHAASELNKSQTSVTKTVREIEHALELELFQRSTRGVALTAFGKALLPLAEAAEQEFQEAQSVVPPVVLSRSAAASHFFRMDVSEKWLDAFVATSETRNITAAAQHLDVTSAAVSANLRKLEDILATTLFERSSLGLELTPICFQLVRHVKLARSYLRQGVEEVKNVAGVLQGRVVIGTLPFVRTVILPRTIIAVLKRYPDLDIATTESPYDDLVTSLRCGDVDFIVGALRGSQSEHDIVEESLLDEDLSVVVRTGHPLCNTRNLTWNDLLKYSWVLPKASTPTRTLVRNLMNDCGYAEPAHIVECSSFVTLRGLIMDSDFVTILSRHQIAREEEVGMLAELPFELAGTRRAIGITTRSSGLPSPAASAVITELRDVVQSLDI